MDELELSGVSARSSFVVEMALELLGTRDYPWFIKLFLSSSLKKWSFTERTAVKAVRGSGKRWFVRPNIFIRDASSEKNKKRLFAGQ